MTRDDGQDVDRDPEITTARAAITTAESRTGKRIITRALDNDDMIIFVKPARGAENLDG